MDKTWNCNECNIEVKDTYCPKCRKNNKGGQRFVSKFGIKKESEHPVNNRPDYLTQRVPRSDYGSQRAPRSDYGAQRAPRTDYGSQRERGTDHGVQREVVPSETDWTCKECDILIYGGREHCVKCKHDKYGKPRMHKCKCGRMIHFKFRACRNCAFNQPAREEPYKSPFAPITAESFAYDLNGKKLVLVDQSAIPAVLVPEPVIVANAPLSFAAIARAAKDLPPPPPSAPTNTTIVSKHKTLESNESTYDTKDINVGWDNDSDSEKCLDIPDDCNVVIAESWDEIE